MHVYSLVDCVFAHLQHDRLKWQNGTILLLANHSTPVTAHSLANTNYYCSELCAAGN